MFRKLFLTTAAAVILLALSATTRAASVTLTGAYNTSATIANYTLSGNQFTFTVVNTSPSGSITAIGFDLPGTDRGSFTLTSAGDPDFNLGANVKTQAGANTTSATFDFALLTGKNFGGGMVSEGIAPGQSATFTITGNFSGLSADQIARSIFLRFQGINPGDRSIVIGPGGPPNAPVPEPMTMILLGSGLAGVAAKVRKRRKAAQPQEDSLDA
ncbi:MAG TPA: PEP-CTERM sorting domain-containing protein [Pyrinomonadaceae bacterium]|jgi:hypothetical protein